MTYKMPKPSRNAITDYDKALSRRQEPLVRERLKAARSAVLATYKIYGKRHGNPSHVTPISIDDDTVKALAGNYRLTYSGASLSAIRDDAMDSAFSGLCPMCSRGEVWTLDHYLPKEEYPEFSILALNLVPVCWSCNNFKGKLTVAANGARFFHAFYDNLPTSTPMIEATISLTPSTVEAEFFVNASLPSQIRRRAIYQFDQLRLKRLYRLASKVEFIERYDTFADAFSVGGSREVAYIAAKQAKQLRSKFGVHYWKGALYDAIANSPGFCGGGFQVLQNI